MKITAEQIMAGTLAFGTVSFTTYKFIELYRKKKATDAIDSLADHIHLDLDDPYIREYVQEAVRQEIYKAAAKAANDVVKMQEGKITSSVNAEIKAQKDILAGSVKSAIANRVGKLNIDDIKKEALAEAKEMASDKLREDMDDILDNYKQGLDNMATIYKAISEKASKSASTSGLSFDFSL
jgi:cell fate (sporulation/competence/biofilm development) regulator YmcA (YheA/YmcA/DUF963 family)